MIIQVSLCSSAPPPHPKFGEGDILPDFVRGGVDVHNYKRKLIAKYACFIIHSYISTLLWKLYFSNSLLINQVKTKKITPMIMKEV